MGRLFAALAGFVLLASGAFAADDDILVIEVGGSTTGTIEIELLPDVAPNHVERIKTLARSGAYDGIVFHRVIEGFMAQTGDVEFGIQGSATVGRAGTGGSDLPNVDAEFSDIYFDVGVMGMARSSNPNSANSQFFIMLSPYPSLNGQYTVLGRVLSGQEVVDSIKLGSRVANGVVSDPDFMEKVYIKSDM